MTATDFDEIKRVALKESRSLLAKWLPGGEFKGAEYVALNPNRPDKTLGSFKINTRSGGWCDFATNEYGTNLLDLLAYINRTEIREAAEELAAELGIVASGWTFERSVFARVNEQPRPQRNSAAEGPKPFYDGYLLQGGFERVAAYDYTEDGEILYQVLRYEYAREPKQFLVRHPDNNGGWLFGAGGRRVLYRGDDMGEAVPTTVFVTEGEKDADRLASLGFTAVTVAFGEGGFRPWLPPRLARFHRGISP